MLLLNTLSFKELGVVVCLKYQSLYHKEISFLPKFLFLQEIHCKTKIVMNFQPKIKTMTRTKRPTVQSGTMELGGIKTVRNQI